MASWITPRRRRGIEILDDPLTPDSVRQRAMSDVARSNALFGGSRAPLSRLRPVWAAMPAEAVHLDIGTGTGDIPERARATAARQGVRLRTIGVDVAEGVLRTARQRLDAVVAADAARLPFPDHSVDLTTCSQLLHHFSESGADGIVAELHRVSRGWVVISDLRRSWVAASGFWLASMALGFHRVTRHDGVVSVLRGFTPDELRDLVRHATGVEPVVRRHAFWRLTAAWRKPPSYRDTLKALS